MLYKNAFHPIIQNDRGGYFTIHFYAISLAPVDYQIHNMITLITVSSVQNLSNTFLQILQHNEMKSNIFLTIVTVVNNCLE